VSHGRSDDDGHEHPACPADESRFLILTLAMQVKASDDLPDAREAIRNLPAGITEEG
jgi:hypothetical protein